jgi:serpin B
VKKITCFLLGLTCYIASAQNNNELALANNRFAFELLSAAMRDSSNENITQSPLSLSLAMALLSNGSANETSASIKTVMHFPTNDNELNIGYQNIQEELTSNKANQLLIANAIWPALRLKLKPDYTKTLNTFYNANATALNYGQPQSSADSINTWCYRNTKGLISELIKPSSIDSSVRLILTNALYFKGVWEKSFDPQASFTGKFFRNNSSDCDITYMKRDCDVSYVSTDSLAMISLDYSNKEFSLFILLPDAGIKPTAIINYLKPDNFAGLVEKMKPHNLVLEIPKFKASQSGSLKSLLTSLDLENPFTPEADFSGITTSEKLHVSDILQSVSIDVNEQGTEAAATTAIIMTRNSKPHFRPNRPFFYVIRENKSNVILFMGYLANPCQN